MRTMRLIILLMVAASATGCTTFGVYENEFSCPASYNGRCISLPAAYDLAKKGQDGADFDPVVQENKKHDGDDKVLQVPVDPVEVAQTSYKESLFKKFDGLLKEASTPVVAPPQIMRVLLLPYKGEGNELYMLRHVYFFADEPRWILGDSLVAVEED